LLITWHRNHGRLFIGARSSARSDDASAQIDLIGAPWMVVSQEPSAVPKAAVCAPDADRR
jgi:hypothetical protein